MLATVRPIVLQEQGWEEYRVMIDYPTEQPRSEAFDSNRITLIDRRMGKRAKRCAHHLLVVGTLRFAHPTAWFFSAPVPVPLIGSSSTADRFNSLNWNMNQRVVEVRRESRRESKKPDN